MRDEICEIFRREETIPFEEEGYFRMTFAFFHLECEAEAWFAENGIPRRDGRFRYTVEMRCAGQEEVVPVSFTIEEVEGEEDLRRLFAEERAKRCEKAPAEGIEIVACMLTASGRKRDE